MTYAFTFDASACSGCKACQIACKDKNNLPTSVLWRRVYEISGGSWTNVGMGFPRPELDDTNGAGKPSPYPVWTTDVFAYNLSIACNHCVHPKCAGVCPTDAYVVRPDGIVYIDESKCMGCGYCSWACPYSAPRYNPKLRHMTKCDFCFDYIDEGKPPACVAACPLRVLDFARISDERIENSEWKVEGGKIELWNMPGTEHPFPLPKFSRTQPHVLLKPHVAMLNGLEKVIANREEIHPPTRVRRTLFEKMVSHRRTARLTGFISKTWCDALATMDELPLVAFTLLGQMAAGMAVFSLFGGPLTLPLLITLGRLIGFGALVSLLHLGTPLNAWRAVNHLKKSWLSREILMFGLFGASWLVSLVMPGMGKLPLALCGIGLVYSMGQVYRFKAAPIWNTWHTPAAFFLSAGLLGILGMNLVTGLAGTWFIAWVLLAAEAWLALSGQNQTHQTIYRIRVVGIMLAMIALGLSPLAPESARMWLFSLIYLLVLAEEILGRWLFYEARQPLL